MKRKHLSAVKMSVFFIASALALSACKADAYNDLTSYISKYNTQTASQFNEKEKKIMNSTSENRITEYFDIKYDTLSNSQTLDLYLPKEESGSRFPLIVFIHGGGWFTGHKSDGQESAWVTLTNKGYAVASINYRLSTEAPHPAGIIDCKTAVRFLKGNAATYNIDPDRIAVAGDSSGGHYALMLALTMRNDDFEDLTRGFPEQNSDVQCAVAWYPATDLSETMRTVQTGEYSGFGADFAWSNIERYVGKNITDTSDNTLISASPVSYINKDMPPILLQHGNIDTICPIDQSERFYRLAIKTGNDKVFFDTINNAEHGDKKFETEENMERIVNFLDEYLKAD